MHTYVQSLVDLIRQVHPPFTLGLYGPEGSGKSFFLHLLERELADHRDGKPSRAERTLPLMRFETYDHPLEVVGARLVHFVISTLERELTTWQKIRLINRSNWHYYYQRVRGWLLPLLLTVLAIEFVIAYWLVGRQVQIDWTTLLVVLGSGLVATLVGVIQGIIRAARNVFQIETSHRTTRPTGFWGMAASAPALDPKREAAAVIDGLGRLLQGRKVVLLADLSGDADKVKEILDWVDLLHEAGVFIIVIAMDPREAAEAIDRQAQRAESEMGRIAAAIEKLAGEKPRERRLIGQAYLERKVQLAFHIPSPSQEAVYHYARYLAEEWLGDEQHQLVAAVQFLGPNPREIKRLVNLYTASSRLLTHLSYDLTPDVRARLVKWLVLSLRWPGVVNVLIDRLNQRHEYPTTSEDLFVLVEEVVGEGLSTDDHQAIRQLLEESPRIRMRDYDDYLRQTLPFISEAAWK
jgi:hypothetical protein